MINQSMINCHGLIVGGTVKERKDAIYEIQKELTSLGVVSLTQGPDLFFSTISNICDKSSKDEKKISFAVFCEDAKGLFDSIEGCEVEKLLEDAINKGVLVYIATSKANSIPEYLQASFPLIIDLKQAGSDDDEMFFNGAKVVKENTSVPEKKEETSKNPFTKKKQSGTEKAVSRSASSALTSVTRSVSTNIINSVTGGKTKSTKKIVEQAATTALSTFLRNIVKEAVKKSK